MEHPNHETEFACADCDFTSPLSNESCPNCGGRMVSLGEPLKEKTTSADGDDVSEGIGDGEIEASGALSLESLQEEESKEDSRDDYSGAGE